MVELAKKFGEKSLFWQNKEPAKKLARQIEFIIKQIGLL